MMVGWRARGVGQEQGSVAGSAELELAPISDMGWLLQVDVELRGLLDSGLNRQFPGFSKIRLCGNTQSHLIEKRLDNVEIWQSERALLWHICQICNIFWIDN